MTNKVGKHNDEHYADRDRPHVLSECKLTVSTWVTSMGCCWKMMSVELNLRFQLHTRPPSQHRREEKSKKSYGDRAACVRARPKPKPADHHHSEFVFIFSVSSFTRFTNIAFCSVHVAASLSRSKKQKQTASSRSAARFHLSFCRVFSNWKTRNKTKCPLQRYMLVTSTLI